MDTHGTEQTGRVWPHIGRALGIDTHLYGQMELWHNRAEKESPAAVAAGYEEWADYFEYRLARMADELANDRSRWYLLETWTDSMVYVCRRLAAWARGEDPGGWVSQHERRPNLVADTRAVPDTDDDQDADRQPVAAAVA